nr:hypothetical protein [Tanacetum cinerariifolium]
MTTEVPGRGTGRCLREDSVKAFGDIPKQPTDYPVPDFMGLCPQGTRRTLALSDLKTSPRCEDLLLQKPVICEYFLGIELEFAFT